MFFHQWFDKRFKDLTVTFNDNENPSTWKLKKKITDRERHFYPQGYSSSKYPEARAVYICSKVEGTGPDEAVMKIKMQIPYRGTEYHSISERTKQAIPSTGKYTINETDALKKLTEGGCSCTPALLGWTHKTQGDHLWVPGGYIDFILMEKLPGIAPEDAFWGFDQKERDQLRESFKEGWLEVKSYGILNHSTKMGNLLWDRENKKCYFVDFEKWAAPKEDQVWADTTFMQWGMVIWWNNQML